MSSEETGAIGALDQMLCEMAWLAVLYGHAIAQLDPTGRADQRFPGLVT